MAPSLRNLPYYTLRLAFFIASNLYCFVSYMVWMTVFTPLRLLAPHAYWKIEHELFYWLETVCVSWISSGGYKVIECGDDISSLHDKNCLLMPNHQSTADVPMVMLALHSKKLAVSKLMWVIYKLYKWTHFGIVCQHRRDYFIDAGQKVRTREMAKFKKHLVNSYLKLGKKWIVVYPEGGFLSRNQESSQRYAERNNLPKLNHVLLPRVGAVKAILDTVGESVDESAYFTKTRSSSSSDVDTASKTSLLSMQTSSSYTLVPWEDPCHPVKWVVDMTIAYKDKIPQEILDIGIGFAPRKDILVHWRTYRVKDIPRDEEGLTAWLFKRYVEKENMLDNYYKRNIIPKPSIDSSFPPLRPRYFRFDVLYQVLAHTALFTLFYLQVYLVIQPLVYIAAPMVWSYTVLCVDFFY